MFIEVADRGGGRADDKGTVASRGGGRGGDRDS